MKETVTLSRFRDVFKQTRSENFSYEGLEALFNYFVDLEQDLDMEIELDHLAICLDFEEYADIQEFYDNYSAEDYPTIEDIEDDTTVISVDGERFIIEKF